MSDSEQTYQEECSPDIASLKCVWQWKLLIHWEESCLDLVPLKCLTVITVLMAWEDSGHWTFEADTKVKTVLTDEEESRHNTSEMCQTVTTTDRWESKHFPLVHSHSENDITAKGREYTMCTDGQEQEQTADLWCVSDSGQTVSNDNDSSAFHGSIDGFLHQMLTLCI